MVTPSDKTAVVDMEIGSFYWLSPPEMNVTRDNVGRCRVYET